MDYTCVSQKSHLAVRTFGATAAGSGCVSPKTMAASSGDGGGGGR